MPPKGAPVAYKPRPTGASVLKKQVTPPDQRIECFWLQWKRPYQRIYPFEGYRSTGKDVPMFFDKDVEHVTPESNARDLGLYVEKLKRPVKPDRDFIKDDIHFYTHRNVNVWEEARHKASPLTAIPKVEKSSPIRPYTTHDMDYKHFGVSKSLPLPIRVLQGRKREPLHLV